MAAERSEERQFLWRAIFQKLYAKRLVLMASEAVFWCCCGVCVRFGIKGSPRRDGG